MRFLIRHLTTYRYSAPVRLGPQRLRFQPRYDVTQELLRFQQRIEPVPVAMNRYLDPEGNTVTQTWFDRPTQLLRIDVSMEVEVLRRNPFDYLLEPQAARLPMSYEDSLGRQLAPYRGTQHGESPIAAFAQSLADEVQGQTLAFLDALSRRINRFFVRTVREQGGPQPPVVTLAQGRGACRDLTVLFVEVCRIQGLASRFVSGYQKGDLERDRRYLHAWPEVYVPGGGWRGYDPSHGGAVSDEHVAVAAAALAEQATPVDGTFFGAGVTSELEAEISIEVRNAGWA